MKHFSSHAAACDHATRNNHTPCGEPSARFYGSVRRVKDTTIRGFRSSLDPIAAAMTLAFRLYRVASVGARKGGPSKLLDFLDKRRVVKRPWGLNAGRRNVNYTETEEHKIKPHLRAPRDHECVLVDCERGVSACDAVAARISGTVAKWFSHLRRVL
jgi:hypothetical protein